MHRCMVDPEQFLRTRKREKLYRIDLVGVDGLNLNITERKKGGGKKGTDGFVQDRCGWQREPEQNGGREGERKKGRVKFVQGKCGWRRGPEQDGGREGGRKEREGRICSG